MLGRCICTLVMHSRQNPSPQTMLQRGTIIMRSSLVRVHCAFPHVLGSTEGTDVEEIGTHAGTAAILEKELSRQSL